MKEEDRKRIEEIIGEIRCPKGFRCVQSGFEILCRARDRGLETYLECLEANFRDCKFVVTYGGTQFCQCPLRVYIAKRFEK